MSRSTIIQHYAALHQAGVLHNDVELRHWLVSCDASVRVIDFDHARTITDEGFNRKKKTRIEAWTEACTIERLLIESHW